eukprot:scaffold10325_cov123-Isochrysis_galbana.AAC.1
MSDADESDGPDDAEEDGLAVTALLRTLDLRRGVRPRARLLLRPLSAIPPLAAGAPPDRLPTLPSLVRDAAGRPRLCPPEPNTDLALCGCGVEVVDGVAALRDLSVSGSPTCLARSSSSVEPVGRSTLGAGALGADGVLRVSYLHAGGGGDEDDGGCSLGSGGDGPRLPRELRSSALVQYADRVDVIAPADNMKAFFKLLHTESAISLAVHRVGNTLVLEGLELDRGALGGSSRGPAKRRGAKGVRPERGGGDRPTGGTQAGVSREEDDGRGSGPVRPAGGGGGGRLQLANKALHSRFLTYSLALEPPRPDGQDSNGGAPGEGPGLEGRRGGKGGGGEGGGGEAGECEKEGFERGRSGEGGGGVGCSSIEGGSSGASDGGENDDSLSDGSEAEEWMPSKRPPHGFLRTLRWQLGDLNVLLGSDTLVFREAAGGVSRLDTSRSADGYASSGVSVALVGAHKGYFCHAPATHTRCQASAGIVARALNIPLLSWLGLRHSPPRCARLPQPFPSAHFCVSPCGTLASRSSSCRGLVSSPRTHPPAKSLSLPLPIPYPSSRAARHALR